MAIYRLSCITHLIIHHTHPPGLNSAWLLSAADGTDKAGMQEVLTGRFQAWSPCLRGWGAEGLALDLFSLREVVGSRLEAGHSPPFGPRVRVDGLVRWWSMMI